MDQKDRDPAQAPAYNASKRPPAGLAKETKKHQKINVPVTFNLIIGIVAEPIDWIMTGVEIVKDPLNPLSCAGLIPFVPSGSKKAVEGIYEVATKAGKEYVGQSGNVGKRLGQHVNKGKITEEAAENARVTEVPGGKTAREVAEQKRIDEKGGIGSGSLENERNPIGPKRKDLLDDDCNKKK